MTISKSSTARQLGDEVMQSAEQAVDATRDLASEAANKASDKVHELRREVEPSLEQWTARLQTAAQRGLEAAIQSTDKARESMQRGVNVAGQYVADQPVKSVLIAAAAGAVITALIISASRRR